VSNAIATSSRKPAPACADFLWRQDATVQSLSLERLSIEAGRPDKSWGSRRASCRVRSRLPSRIYCACGRWHRTAF
jgi:hypothetical protein